MTQPIVIIGTGLAGYMLAKEFRKLDTAARLEIYTLDGGEFYSKPLLSTALTNNKTADMLAVNDVVTMAQQLDAKIHTHTAVKHLDDLAFSKLILACGAKKITVPLQGDAINEIQSVNNLSEYREFRHWLENKKHIAILGAGLVGCEFANDLVNAGYKVDLIAPEQHPLARLVPNEIGFQLTQGLQDKKVTWHLGVLAKAVNRKKDGFVISLSDGSELCVDGVFSAVGLRPNTFLAEQSGIAVNQGIVVDRWLRTSQSNVYALGDCAEVAGTVKMYVAPILQCARALAAILAGGEEPVHYPSMPVVIKTPACPIVASPPPLGVEGEWHFEGDPGHKAGLFYDHSGSLRGFALVGEKVRDRMELAKKLPLVFEG